MVSLVVGKRRLVIRDYLVHHYAHRVVMLAIRLQPLILSNPDDHYYQNSPQLASKRLPPHAHILIRYIVNQ